MRAAGGCFQARPLRSVTGAAGPLQRLILCCGGAAGAGERERGSRTCTVRGPPDSGSIPQHGGRRPSAPGRALGGGGMRTHVHVCTVCMRVHICTHVCTHVHVSAYVHCTRMCMRVCVGGGCGRCWDKWFSRPPENKATRSNAFCRTSCARRPRCQMQLVSAWGGVGNLVLGMVSSDAGRSGRSPSQPSVTPEPGVGAVCRRR